MNELKALYKQQKSIGRQRDKLNKQMVEIYDKIKTIEEANMLSSIPDPITPEFVCNLDWNKLSGKPHKIIDSWLWTNYGDKGLKYDGCDPDANYSPHFMLKFDTRKPFEEQLGFLDFLPFYKSNLLGVFESTLSQHGVFWIDLKELSLMKTTYGRSECLEKFKDIKELMKYVYERHPYC